MQKDASIPISVHHFGIILGILIDSRLSFEDLFKMTLGKINKTIGLIRKLQYILPRTTLLTLYDTFVRLHLDFGDKIYDLYIICNL